VDAIGRESGISPAVSARSTFVSSSTILEDPYECEKPQAPGLGQRSRVSTDERSRDRTVSSVHAGILQFHLRRAQEELGQVAFGDQLEAPQQAALQVPVQDGDDQIHHERATSRGLDDFRGPSRCVLPHPYPQNIAEISSIHAREEGFPVCGSSLRVGSRTVCLHEDHGDRCKSGSQAHDASLPILGRLSDEECMQRGVNRPDSSPSSRLRHPRIHQERREVGVGPEAMLLIPRRVVRPGTCYRQGSAGEMGEDVSSNIRSSSSTVQSGSGVVRGAWPADISSGSCSSWQTTYQETADSSEYQLGSSSRHGCPDSDVGGVQDSASLVAPTEGPGHRSIHSTLHSGSSHVHGCLYHRLGCSCGRRPTVRILDTRRESSPHQQLGASGCDQGSDTVNQQASRQSSPPVDRQLDSSQLHQSTRRDSCADPECVSRGTVAVSTQIRRHDEGYSHPRVPECSGRCTIQVRKSDSNRMDSSSGGVSAALLSVGDPTGGLIRDQIQQPVTVVRVAVPRRESHGRRRSVSELGRDGRLRLSANDPVADGSRKDSTVNSKDPSHSSSMAGKGVVPGSSRVARRSSLETPSMGQVATATEVAGLQHEPPGARPSRLASVRGILRQTGFSDAVAERISTRNRRSTARIYQSRWAAFENWCGTERVDPLTASVPIIAEFLLHLFGKGFEVGTVRGYRCAIAATLKHTGRSIGTDKNLTDLLTNLALERPAHKRSVPAWDLALVLKALTRPPYEPLNKADMKYLSFKTAFLLALATGSRVSELHAIDVRTIRFSEGRQEVSFAPAIQFLSKTQNPEDVQRALARISVKSLTDFVDEQMQEDRSLCPVRALRYYLDKTNNVRRASIRLFISCLAPHAEITKATLSAWIKRTVKLAYQLSPDEDRAFAQVRAHDIRGLAASWAFKNSVPLIDVLRAGTWKNHTTFTSFYLKDVTSIQDGLRSLGTLSVAQQRI
jgi:integrase